MFKKLCEGLNGLHAPTTLSYTFKMPESTVVNMDIAPDKKEVASAKDVKIEFDTGAPYSPPVLIKDVQDSKDIRRHIFNYSAMIFSKITSIADIRPAFQYVTDNFSGYLDSELFFTIITVLLKYTKKLFTTPTDYIYFSFTYLRWIIQGGYTFTTTKFDELLAYLYSIFPDRLVYKKIFTNVFYDIPVRVVNQTMSTIASIVMAVSQRINEQFIQLQEIATDRLYGTREKRRAIEYDA